MDGRVAVLASDGITNRSVVLLLASGGGPAFMGNVISMKAVETSATSLEDLLAGCNISY